MTKKEMFGEVINLATEAGREDIVEFCNKEVELLNKRYSRERKVNEKKLAERAELAEAIIKVVETASYSHPSVWAVCCSLMSMAPTCSRCTTAARTLF